MDLWDTQIYPGMKQGIIGVLLASQETTDVRKNCFELYGADFMLSEDLRPWLIEINSCPCMSASTSVTARMCAQCLEDTIKGRNFSCHPQHRLETSVSITSHLRLRALKKCLKILQSLSIDEMIGMLIRGCLK